MKAVLESVFDLIERNKTNLLEHERNSATTSSIDTLFFGEEEVNFDFYLDESGKYETEIKKDAYGVTVKCKFWILFPDTSYSIKILTNTGVDLEFNDIPVNQEIQFEIKTKRWEATSIGFELSSNVPNLTGNGKFSYSF